MELKITLLPFRSKQTTKLKKITATTAEITTTKPCGNLLLDTLSTHGSINMIPISTEKQDILIMKVLKEAKEKKEKVTLKEIAQKTGLTQNQVIKAIYVRKNNGLRKAFNDLDVFCCKKAALHHAQIQNVIDNANYANSVLTIDEIAEKLKLSPDQVKKTIYKGYSDIRFAYDNIKGGKRGGIPSEKYKKRATYMIQSAVNFNTTEPKLTDAESEYIRYLSRQLSLTQLEGPALEEFIKGFTEFPGFAIKLIDTKTEHGHSRISRLNQPKYIKAFFDLYRANPDLTDKILFDKNKDGLFTYTNTKAIYILKAASISEKLITPTIEQPYFTMKLIKAIDQNKKPRFGVNEIIKMTECNKQEPELMELLINSCNNDSSPRFTGEQICYIIEQYSKKPSLVMNLLKTNHLGETITNILQTFESKDKTKIKLVKKFLDNESVVEYSPYKVLKELKNYDTRKEIHTTLAKYSKNMPDEIIQEMRDKYGSTALEFMNTLGEIGFSKREIFDIMQKANIKFSISEYYELMRTNPHLTYPNAHIEVQELSKMHFLNNYHCQY